ncbi:hypothetical protein ABPG72_014547 [Tetrahymena utriculariae]
MIVNSQFLEELQVVEALDFDGFEKSLNYTISYIAKSDTTTRFNEILEIEEESANQIFPVLLKLVSFFAKFNAGEREFKAHLEMIQLNKDKKLLFLQVYITNYNLLQNMNKLFIKNIQKMKESEKHLRKALGLLERDNEPEYANLRWRFDLQVSSRTNESETKPKILMQLDLLNNGKLEGHILETDYANLKHLTDELTSALKLHNSLAQKKIQKKFV